MLSKIGYRVTPVNESPQTLEIFKGAPNEFDLVITDLTMSNKGLAGVLTRALKDKRIRGTIYRF